MRLPALLAAVCLSIAACGGEDEAPPSAADCEAIQRTIMTAAEAYEIENGAPPADIDALLGDYLRPDTPTDWFAVDGRLVAGGPCD